MPRGTDYWIRFPSPSQVMADMVYARVHEPPGVSNPPTLIFGHGMCVEFDHYHNLIDEIAGLTEQGIRVVGPEAPWHGRRVLPGHFGGEQLLSTAPMAQERQKRSSCLCWIRCVQYKGYSGQCRGENLHSCTSLSPFCL